jgi:hypothetical protein
MSKKKLNIEGISNELQGASLFFTQEPVSPPPQPKPEPVTPEPAVLENVPPPEIKKTTPEIVKPKLEKSRKHETMHARMHALNSDNIASVTQANPAYDPIEAIRKSVKQVGKEEFYLRLTSGEKSEVTRIVFTFNELYSGEGRKVSANDIGRIAIHQLLIDYRENGENSVLARVLAALNA